MNYIYKMLDLITLTILGERYKLLSSSLWSLLHSPFTSILDPNIRLKILYSNTVSLRSPLNVSDHVALFMNLKWHKLNPPDGIEVSLADWMKLGHSRKKSIWRPWNLLFHYSWNLFDITGNHYRSHKQYSPQWNRGVWWIQCN